VLQTLLYDARGHVIEVGIRTPTPSRISILRHLISRPAGVASDSAKGLLPSLVLIEDGDGTLTRVRFLPSPAFGG